MREAGAPKGEIVVVVGPAAGSGEASDEALDAYLVDALMRVSVKEAAQAAAAELRVSRKRAYARALELKGARDRQPPSGAAASPNGSPMLFLIGKGYRILGHALRTPYGEVDVRRGNADMLVIVEVKARTTMTPALIAVTPKAQDRIARAAQTLAGRWRLTTAPIRFDLIVVGAEWFPKHERGAWFDEGRRRA